MLIVAAVWFGNEGVRLSMTGLGGDTYPLFCCGAGSGDG